MILIAIQVEEASFEGKTRLVVLVEIVAEFPEPGVGATDAVALYKRRVGLVPIESSQSIHKAG